MPKEDKTADTGLDVQIVYPQSGLPGNAVAPTPLPNGAGYIVAGGTANQPIILVPPTQASAPAQPSIVVITVGPKKEEAKKEKKSSSVFQKL